MTTPAQGIPLLSGPPPTPAPPEASSCRKCGKEFNIIFTRQRKCMHCGYGYCSSCTDYQALMPRRGPTHGHDIVPVCGFCIELLNVTALGKTQLKGLPLAKLRRYVDAYNIQVKGPIDKNDLVDAVLAARTPQGCLPTVNEAYYRRHSVPKHNPSSSTSSGSSHPSAATRARNLFSRGTTSSSSHTSSSNTSTAGSTGGRTYHNTSTTSNTSTSTRTDSSFPRPDLDPRRQRQAQGTPSRASTPRSPASDASRARTTSVPLNPRTTRPAGAQPNIPRPTSSYGAPRPPTGTRASSASASTQPTPSPAPPPLSTLITLPRSSLAALSVGTLKKILWDARVRVPPGVVEKDELVERVWALVEEERRKGNEANAEDGDADFYDDQGDEMDGVEEGDREEEVVVEMVDPESEVRTDALHERERENNATGEQVQSPEMGGASHVDGDVEMSGPEHEEHLAAPEISPDISSPQDASSSQIPMSSPSPQPPSPSRTPAKAKPHPRPAKQSDAERSGLCVICQDEEANIAIVDCGHLAMCRSCSDLVLASSRECPLCRTRIVTEARLLRIFKT
ncbi:hypothetical protein HYDPIDRAFT_42521, partial [Hydnomerulius pinastri MD-312]